MGSTPPLLYVDVISRFVHTHIRHIPTQFLILVDEIVQQNILLPKFNVIYKPIPSAFSCPVHALRVLAHWHLLFIAAHLRPPFPHPLVVHDFIQSRAIVRP